MRPIIGRPSPSMQPGRCLAAAGAASPSTLPHRAQSSLPGAPCQQQLVASKPARSVLGRAVASPTASASNGVPLQQQSPPEASAPSQSSPAPPEYNRAKIKVTGPTKAVGCRQMSTSLCVRLGHRRGRRWQQRRQPHAAERFGWR